MKHLIVAVLIALGALPVAAHAQAQPAAPPTATTTQSVPQLPSRLKGTTFWVYGGREYKADVTLVITHQEGGTGGGTYSRYNSVAFFPPCNNYVNAPMSFTWDGVTFSAVVNEGDKVCEKRIAVKRGTDHYFVAEDPKAGWHSYLDAVE